MDREKIGEIKIQLEVKDENTVGTFPSTDTVSGRNYFLSGPSIIDVTHFDLTEKILFQLQLELLI